MGDFNFLEEFAEEGGALPEQRVVKRQILHSRKEAKKQLKAFNGHSKQGKEVRDTLYSYYLDVVGHVEDENVSEEIQTSLSEIKNILYDQNYNINKIGKPIWSQIFETLDRTLKEIGVLKITRKKKERNFAYEVFGGIGWHPHKMWKNWDLLKLNIKNLNKEIKAKDKDTFIFIWGSKGLGKSTLALHLMNHISNEITEENIIFDYDQFKEAAKEGVSPYLIDEIANIFNKRRAMSKGNVEGTQIMDNIRHKNTMGLGCTIKFDRIDKLFIDNIDVGLEVFEEGRFKLYSREKIDKFKKKSGEWELPQPSFIGQFPKKKDKIWEMYKEVEPAKDKSNDNEEEGKEEKTEKSAHCNKCGYDWTPRKENIDEIKKCPKCQSPHWNDSDVNEES